jgi:hypothetical protein
MLLTWAIGTGSSVLIGSLGVRLVTSAVTPARVSPLTYPEVAAALEADAAADADLRGGPPAAEPSPPAASAAPSPSPSGAGTRPQQRAPSRVPSPSPPPPQTQPPDPGVQPTPAGGELDRRGTASPPAQPSPTTSPRTPVSTVRTIQSEGGTVAVRFEDGTTTLVWARPNAGFEVRVNAKGPELVDVEFRSDRHTSTIRAWWGAAGPVEAVREFGPGGREGRDGR